MSYTTVTIADTVQDASGAPVPFAVVVAWPKVGFRNAGTKTNATSAIAASDGTFSLALNATDDAGTATIDPAASGQTCGYHIRAFDPRTGAHLFDADVTVPHATTPTTLAALPIIY